MQYKYDKITIATINFLRIQWFNFKSLGILKILKKSLKTEKKMICWLKLNTNQPEREDKNMARASKTDLIKSKIEILRTFTIPELCAEAGCSTPTAYAVVNQMGLKKTVKNGKVAFTMCGGGESAAAAENGESGDSTENVTAHKVVVPVAERFLQIERFTKMVIDRFTPSFLLTGMAGVGKTYHVKKMLETSSMVREKDYVVCQGKATPFSLYRFMHDYREKFILVDDCDCLLTDLDSINLLKAAMDSYSTRIVGWPSKATEKEGLDSSFEFSGGIVFISNKSVDTIDTAIRSRCICQDIRLSRDELYEYVVEILPRIEYLSKGFFGSDPLDMGQKMEVVAYVWGCGKDNINLRTVVNALRIRASHPGEWKNMVLCMDTPCRT